MNIHHLLPLHRAICLLAAASLALASPACIGSVAAVPAAVASQWRLDVRQGSDGSQNFRIDPELRCSGSGQASARGIADLSNQLQAVRKADEPLWIIDLRQESHGFWNGEAVSWHGPHNAANAGIVVGAGRADARAISRPWVGAILRCNGVVEETGLAAGVQGDPAIGIAWLANKLAPWGESLEAGQIVLAGSFTRPVAAKAGDDFEADYGPLGKLNFNFI